MSQPPTIYKPGKLNYLWNYLGSSLKSFAAALSPYLGGDNGVKRYKALLTQTGIDPPVADVLENTLGEDVIWQYGFQGNYFAIFNIITFNQSKTVTNCSQSDGNNSGVTAIYIQPPNTIRIATYDYGGFNINEVLYYTLVEIEVYP